MARLAKKAASSPVRLFSPSTPVAPTVLSPAAPVASQDLAVLSPAIGPADAASAAIDAVRAADLVVSPASPVVYDNYVFPPMGSPAPLSMYGQTIWPAPSSVGSVVNTRYQDGDVMFAINSYGQIAYPPELTTFFTESRTAAAPAAAPVTKRAYTHLDLDSSSDDEHHHAPHRDVAVGTPPAKPQKRTSRSESDDSSSSDTETQDAKAPAKKMARITKEERDVVCTWIQLCRADGRMSNGRWLRGAGAKGQSMTATSGEVKTSGAQDALAS